MSIDRILLIGVVFALTVTLMVSEIARFGQTRTLETRLEAAEVNADAALKAIITPETLAAAEASVYMVVNDKHHYGSAFVLDRERGLLVTAAHVAADLDFEDPERHYSVINRHSRKPLRIRAKEVHAGFDVFRRIVETYQPIDPESRVASPNLKRVIDIADDAALLFIDPIDPETGENLLGPALPLASEETLAALAPGDPIAVIGYPVDTITSNIQEDSAAARVERGVIAAMLSPIDQVENAGDTVTQNLIVHRMAAAPGSSGGPILNREGEIIGISSHGHDSLHSNGDSLAQRADVIHDMITPFREQDGLERIYIPDWKKRLSKWPKAEDILPYAFYLQRADLGDDPAPRTMTIGEIEKAEKPPFRSRTYTPEFGEAEDQFILYADDLIPASETGEEEEEEDEFRLPSAERPVFLIDERGEYASYKIRFDKNENHAVFVFDYSMAWTSNGYCPLRIYYRRKGEDVLRSTRGGRMPSIMIASSDDKEMTNEYDIIVRRGFCDTISKEYLFGMVSWKPEKEEAQVNVAQDSGERILASFDQRGARIGNFFNCNIEPFRNEERCAKAIKVRNIVPAKDNPDEN